MICHLFIDEHTPDHHEMTLHHIAHLSLSSGYIFANMMPYGKIIAFLNDFSDIFIALSKFLHMAGYSVKWTGTAIFFTLIAWFIFRIYLMIIGPLWTIYFHKYGPGREHLQPYFDMSWYYITVLLSLNIYWLFLLIKMVANVILGGEVRDV